MENAKKTQARVANIGLLIALVGLVLIINPIFELLDPEDGGFALSFFGFFVSVTGLATWFVYFGRTRAMDGIMRDEGDLVHWKYEPSFWRAYTRAEFALEKETKGWLFRIGSAFALVCGIGFFLYDHESGAIVFLVMLGLIALMAVLAFVVPRVNRAIYRGHAGEAVITRNSAYVGGRLHVWNTLGIRLKAVGLHEGRHDFIEIAYESPPSLRVPPQTEVVRVPVPPGQEEAAKRVVDTLEQQILAAT